MKLPKSLTNRLPDFQWQRPKKASKKEGTPQPEPKIHKPKILLVGRTGVGKSALINAIFGAEMAASGHGKPVTNGFKAYEDEIVPIAVYDSAGWEGGGEKEVEFRTGLQSFLKKNKMDAIWFAIDAPGARFTEFDVQLLVKIFKNYNTIIVLTKCDVATDEQIIDILRAIAVKNVFVEDIWPVSANPLIPLESHEQRRFSPQELVQKTLALITPSK